MRKPLEVGEVLVGKGGERWRVTGGPSILVESDPTRKPLGARAYEVAPSHLSEEGAARIEKAVKDLDHTLRHPDTHARNAVSDDAYIEACELAARYFTDRAMAERMKE